MLARLDGSHESIPIAWICRASFANKEVYKSLKNLSLKYLNYNESAIDFIIKFTNGKPLEVTEKNAIDIVEKERP